MIFTAELPPGTREHELRIELRSRDGIEIIGWTPAAPAARQAIPEPATEPAQPEQIETIDEVFLTGLHLWQYRHATRSPEPYWEEALRRDPGDARANNAMGVLHLRRGEFSRAEHYFRTAISRLTERTSWGFIGYISIDQGLLVAQWCEFHQTTILESIG